MWEDFSSVNLRVAVPLRWGQENAVAAQWPGCFHCLPGFFFMTLGVNCVSFAARTRQETISADFCHSPADQRGTHHRKSLVSPGHPVGTRRAYAGPGMQLKCWFPQLILSSLVSLLLKEQPGRYKEMWAHCGPRLRTHLALQEMRT